MAGKSDSYPHIRSIQNTYLNSPVSDLKGVGPKRAALLIKRGLATILDLLYFIPRGYEDLSRIVSISETEPDKTALVKGKVIWAGEEKLYGRRKRLYKIILGGDAGQLELVWFNLNSGFFSSLSNPETEILVYGRVKKNGNKIQIYHPDVSVYDPGTKPPGILPVYPSVEGVSNKIIRSVIKTAIDKYLDLIIDPVPPDILEKTKLPDLKKTLNSLHFPEEGTDPDQFENGDSPFHKRLVFDRFFSLMIKLRCGKYQREKLKAAPMIIQEEDFGKIPDFFPFRLTGDQLKCMEEIYSDLTGGKLMNRLIMGDVGTGKTLVAVAAAFMAVKNNCQVSLMAPTQLLAEQHMRYMESLPDSMGFKPVLLTGNLKKPEKDRVYESIKKGQYNIIIGTHALLQAKLEFKNLKMAIIDEQHRFGVRQRSTIIEKVENVHVITMSATPIPRTIAITLYGDRDISVIKEYPDTRKPVSTVLADRSEKRWIFNKLREKISENCQAYIICPLIDESENSELKSVAEMAESLKRILPDFKTGYVHGRMDPGIKEAVLKDFRGGKIHILVATTVIEVGIHVPNASLMIIEHPERLGLAQLHQLRGRIGRDGKGGTCIMIMPENPSDGTIKRLKILAECSDGFEISKKDMEFRGHGEISGIRQSGFNEIEIGDIINYHDLLKKTDKLVKELFKTDPDFSLPQHRLLKAISLSPSL